MSAKNSGMYDANFHVTESSTILNIGATVRWHLGHTNYVFEEDDASYPLGSVCEACTTLENIGKAFLGFGGIGLCLVTLVIVAIACSALGCGMFDGNGKFVIGLLNLSIFSSFLSMLLMLCGVAAMVAPEGDEYNFKVFGAFSTPLNPNIFIPDYGAICHYLSLSLCMMAACLLKGDDGGGSGGGRGGGRAGGAQGSRMYGGAAMRPAVGGARSKSKMHGKRPSGMKAGKSGGYV
ncbi:hypothetical protein TrCOL_g7309 [Triparma columacea]|uniref:Uncharacterized protein n=1 Tax=Triparma columacea TaxID=722753 RepID=A0A9W7FY34_9STRA|nr:hypothetical protein TrCOL_g7309 [Triparma columacea]